MGLRWRLSFALAAKIPAASPFTTDDTARQITRPAACSAVLRQRPDVAVQSRAENAWMDAVHGNSVARQTACLFMRNEYKAEQCSALYRVGEDLGGLLSRRQQHAVNHMDDAIGRLDVGDEDLYVIVEVHCAIPHFDADV